MEKTFLKDLAQAAGVSVSQASRALNGKPKVAPEVRQRIHELARQMNYRNQSAKHPLTIAVLTQWIDDSSGNLQNALLREARRRKIRFAVIPTEHVSLLDEWLFDGVIAFSRNLLPDWHEHFNLPLVAVNSYGNLLDRIPGIDPEGGVRLAVEHLAGLGHRRIALLQPAIRDARLPRDYRKGMTELSEAAKAWKIGDEVRHQFHDWEALEETLHALLAEGFTAFIGATVKHGPRLLAYFRSRGKRVPGDVSVIAGENEEVSPFLVPPLTTVAYDYPGLIRSAVDLLLAEIEGRPELRTIQCPSKLIIRESTGPIKDTIS